MQTLGISDSTVRTDGRLKSLFWPAIQSAVDVDYLGTQGLWVCTIVAVLSLLFLLLMGQFITGVVTFLVFYFGGVGVRERDPFAATAVLLIFFADTVFTALMMGLFNPAVIVVRTVIIALLVSNLRATFMAWSWRPESEEAAMPQRMSDTFADTLSDQLPMWLWPKIRIVYYIFAAIYLALVCLGMMAIILRGTLVR
jgi:hypothetical protein